MSLRPRVSDSGFGLLLRLFYRARQCRSLPLPSSHMFARLTHSQLFWLFSLALLIQRCVAVQFNVLDLSPDEAHYWEWSKRLDLAYYSKGPLVALAIKLSTLIFGDTEFGVRFPAIFCESLFGFILYFYARSRIGAANALLLTIATRLSVVFLSMGFAITTDPLLLVCWTLALISIESVIVRGDSRYWIVFGLAAGVGVLGKYTGALLPVAAALFVLFDRESRRELLSPWLYLGALAFILCLSPIFIWNLAHDFVNLGHNAAHLVVTKRSGSGIPVIGNFLELFGAQLGLFGPFMWLLFMYALYLGVKEWRAGDRLSGFLATTAILLLSVCFVVSLSKRVYANWPMPVGITAIFLIVRLWNERGAFQRWVSASIPLHLIFCVLIHLPLFGVTFGIPGKNLTTKKLVGWSEIAREVKPLNSNFILTENYDVASSLAFYLNRPGDVYAGVFGDRRMNQFDLWRGLSLRKGQTATIVLKGSEELALLSEYFAEVQFLKEVQINYSGSVVQNFKILEGTGFTGKEFPLPSAR